MSVISYRLPRIVTVALCVLVVVCARSTSANDTPLAAAPPAISGSIEGVITYRADAAKPWRYARYYVKNAKTGELAEAVVALRGRGLRAAKSREPATKSIDQKDFSFQPELVAVRVGDSVTFTNSDSATHNVRSSSDVANFNITIAAGAAGRTVKFDKAGGIRRPVEIGCVFHSNMKAWVFVFDHPFYAVTEADGRFKLENVPPGEYELEVAHAPGGLKTNKEVRVTAGETLAIDVALSAGDKK